jgi:hypothetical protein
MTRQEVTGERSLEFSRWIRKHLPDSSTGYMVGNLDWILWNYKTRRLILLEEKTHGAQVAPWFSRMMREVFAPALKSYCDKNGIEFKGFHVITFQNTSPQDGIIKLDGTEISEEDLIVLLSG